jgi:hypothetical protein
MIYEKLWGGVNVLYEDVLTNKEPSFWKLNVRVPSLYGIKYAWLIATEKDKHGDNERAHVGWMRGRTVASLSLVSLCKALASSPENVPREMSMKMKGWTRNIGNWDQFFKTV